MPRIFVAIALPDDIAAALATVLPPGLAGLRAVDPARLHITLAFVGTIPDDRVATVVSGVKAAAHAARDLDLRIEGVGRFPARGRIGTVWAGLAGDTAALAGLAEGIRAELAKRGVPFDPKPFRAHLTLARLGRSATDDDARIVASAADRARISSGLAFTAHAVDVMESTLSPRGPRYSRRVRVSLAQKGPR